jgi:hypothetical protein
VYLIARAHLPSGTLLRPNFFLVPDLPARFIAVSRLTCEA